MALFNDGLISTAADLQQYENSILTVASTENIDLALKLLDANLSPKLVVRLAQLFPDSVHVFEIGLERVTPDEAIWEYARYDALEFRFFFTARYITSSLCR